MKVLQNVINEKINYSNFSEDVIILGVTRTGKNTYSYTVRNKNNVIFYNVPGQAGLVDKAIMGYINGDHARPALLSAGIKSNVAESSFVVPRTVNIRLDWTDNTDNELGFSLEKKKGVGSYAVLATLGANVLTYTDIDVYLDDTYYYRVKAFNTFGESDYSNVVSTA